MTFPTVRLAAVLLPGLLLLGGGTPHGPEDPAPLRAPPPGVAFLPLQKSTRLTYMGDDGEPFTLTYGQESQVPWFDGEPRLVVPVMDTRCGCQILYQNADGEIRAIGAIRRGALVRWGEYYVIWPRNAGGPRETVITPAGRFEHAVRITTPQGNTWFAPGVGIVKTDHYVLTAITTSKEG